MRILITKGGTRDLMSRFVSLIFFYQYTNLQGQRKQVLFLKVAELKIVIIKHYVFRPVRLILAKGQTQPGLIISIVVDNSSIFYLSLVKGGVITKSQYMPTSVQRIGEVVEGNQSRRQ